MAWSRTINQKKLGENLKRAREEKGMSQEDVAALCGIKQETLSKYEGGSQVPRALRLRELAVTLSVTTDYLLNLEDPIQKVGRDQGQSRKQVIEELIESLDSEKIGNKDKALAIQLELF